MSSDVHSEWKTCCRISLLNDYVTSVFNHFQKIRGYWRASYQPCLLAMISRLLFILRITVSHFRQRRQQQAHWISACVLHLLFFIRIDECHFAIRTFEIWRNSIINFAHSIGCPARRWCAWLQVNWGYFRRDWRVRVMGPHDRCPHRPWSRFVKMYVVRLALAAMSSLFGALGLWFWTSNWIIDQFPQYC